jgi:enolase
MPITVRRIVGYEITDSNGNPTLEAEMLLSNGFRVTSSISSDNVINTYGMRELRDNDMQHYQGLGVKGAVGIINQVIGPRLANANPLDQAAVDSWLNRSDDTPDKSKLGVNTSTVISQLFAKAGAYVSGVPTYKHINGLYTKMFKEELSLEKVPTPMIGMLAGGRNADFKEFHLIPSSSLTFSQAYEMSVDIFHTIRTVMEQLGIAYSHSVYGEYIPARSSNNDMIDVIFDVIQRKNLKLGKHLFFGLTIGGSNFFTRGKYIIKDRPTPLSAPEYYEFMSDLIGKYSVLLVEDPFATDDIDGWRKMFVNFGEQIYIVAHKFLGDKPERLEDMDNGKEFTSTVIKPIYFGTITDTLKAVHKVRKRELTFMVSADKNETDDDFIADFAMAVQCDFVKFGAPSQGERVAKYNRLLKIEQQAHMMSAGQAHTAGAAMRNATPLPKVLLEGK